MNKHCYRIVFSKHLNSLVAVGENVMSAGKAAGGAVTGKSLAAIALAGVTRLVMKSSAAMGGTLLTVSSGALLMSVMPNAQAKPVSPIAVNALPTGSNVTTGKVTTIVNGSTMTVNQSTNKAIVNWNTFDVGSNAKVNINQPSSNAVILNRVVGNDPTQIHGQINANGQVMIVNPNGIVVSKDGAVSASGFTASSYSISDDDFLAGKNKFDRNGTSAGVRIDGKINTTNGGYVALIGAEVTNNGQITSPQGTVVMAAGESVTLPTDIAQNLAIFEAEKKIAVPLSNRVKLTVSAASINTAVMNSAEGVIVTEGGQVLLQAASVADAVASVTHSGRIDTSGQQAGDVLIQADHGRVKVNGSVTANAVDSTGTVVSSKKGGNIIIGKNEQTGVLAKTTDVSEAKLEAQKGFVETSGSYLKSDGVQVKAAEWLLDPTDVEINSGSTPIVAGSTVVLVSTIESALNAGTNVTIETGASGVGSMSSVGVATQGGATNADGNITVNNPISVVNNTVDTPTLKLIANNGIKINASITAAGNNGIHVDMTANGLGGTPSGIITKTGTTIDIKNGNLSMAAKSILLEGNISAKDITLLAKPALDTEQAIKIQGVSSSTTPILKATGNVLISSTQGSITVADSSIVANTPSIVAGGNVTIDNTGSSYGPLASNPIAILVEGNGVSSSSTDAGVAINSLASNTGGIVSGGVVSIRGVTTGANTGVYITSPMTAARFDVKGIAAESTQPITSGVWNTLTSSTGSINTISPDVTSPTFIGTAPMAALSLNPTTGKYELNVQPITSASVNGAWLSGRFVPVPSNLVAKLAPNIYLYAAIDQGLLKVVQITYTVNANRQVFAQETGAKWWANGASYTTSAQIVNAWKNLSPGGDVYAQGTWNYTLGNYIASAQVFGTPLYNIAKTTITGGASSTFVGKYSTGPTGGAAINMTGDINKTGNGGDISFISNGSISQSGAIALAANNTGVAQVIRYDVTEGNNLSSVNVGSLTYASSATPASNPVDYKIETAGGSILTGGNIRVSGSITLSNANHVTATNPATNGIGVSINGIMDALKDITIKGESTGLDGVDVNATMTSAGTINIQGVTSAKDKQGVLIAAATSTRNGDLLINGSNTNTVVGNTGNGVKIVSAITNLTTTEIKLLSIKGLTGGNATADAVNIAANIVGNNNNVVIQALDGNSVNQVAGSISGRNVSVDNTDGAIVLGVIGTAGSKTATTNTAVTLNGTGITATQRVNVLGATTAGTNAIAATASITSGVSSVAGGGILFAGTSTNATKGSVILSGELKNLGAAGSGITVTSTDDVTLGNVSNTGSNGVRVTGGMGHAAGDETGGTILALGTVTNSGGSVGLSMAKPGSALGGAVEAAIGVTLSTADLTKNVTYNQTAGAFGHSPGYVVNSNFVNYRQALTRAGDADSLKPAPVPVSPVTPTPSPSTSTSVLSSSSATTVTLIGNETALPSRPTVLTSTTSTQGAVKLPAAGAIGRQFSLASADGQCDDALDEEDLRQLRNNETDDRVIVCHSTTHDGIAIGE